MLASSLAVPGGLDNAFKMQWCVCLRALSHLAAELEELVMDADRGRPAAEAALLGQFEAEQSHDVGAVRVHRLRERRRIHARRGRLYVVPNVPVHKTMSQSHLSSKRVVHIASQALCAFPERCQFNHKCKCLFPAALKVRPAAVRPRSTAITVSCQAPMDFGPTQATNLDRWFI